jgi:membrane-bound lytic murein transglycosylase D
MCRRLLLLSVICMGFISLIRADDGPKGKKRNKSHTNTTVVSDHAHTTISKNQALTQDFGGLFLVDASENANNGSRLNPRAINFVQDYIGSNKEDLEDMKTWCKPYFNLIDKVLLQYGLPTELKYLAVIESQLKPTAKSWVGAVGPWQLMPETARILGLKVNRKYDERKNYAKSTAAAAKYLRDLYSELNDWLLVIAAYNGGTGNVNRAIKKSHSRDFWSLQYYLPTESRNHVKKFIATHYVFEGQGSVTTLTRDEANAQLSGSAMYVFNRKLKKAEEDNAKTITISGKYYGAVIAKYTLMDLSTFNRYNPDFDKVMSSSNNTYELKLPADKLDLFAGNKYEILNESVQSLLTDGTRELAIQKTYHDVAKKEED